MNLIQRDKDFFAKYNRGHNYQEYEQWLESELKESNSDHTQTLQLLSDILDGKIEIKRQTVKERIKKYIENNLQI